jgi:menaquinone-dependent protoporphyrinogen IX oxidase
MPGLPTTSGLFLRHTHPSQPVDIGLFGGRLEYGRLKWWAVLFAMLIIRAPAGDRRNWPAIRHWAGGLPAAFHCQKAQADGLAAVA